MGLTNRRLSKTVLFVSLVFASPCLAAGGEAHAAALTAQDAQDVRAACQAYRDAWVANDAAAVMATLTDDAVLLPSGMAPIVGSAAIRAFWWPPGASATRILGMELSIEEVGGEGGLAYARGRGSLTFSYAKENKEVVVSQRHTFLNVLRREAKGQWRISHRMWSDLK
jgi:uncharacterized protein (TIGR02246 family)